MSTDYTETLKRIKQTEESTSREILEKRKALEEELRRMEDASAISIAEAKKQAEAFVTSQVENARTASQKQAEDILNSTSAEAKQLSARKLDKSALKKITDKTILSEFK